MSQVIADLGIKQRHPRPALDRPQHDVTILNGDQAGIAATGPSALPVVVALIHGHQAIAQPLHE